VNKKLQIAVALSDDPNPEKAGKKAAKEMRGGLTGAPDFILTFIASGYGKAPTNYEKCLKAFKRVTGNIPSVGCLSPEVFVSGDLPTIKGIATLGIKGNDINADRKSVV